MNIETAGGILSFLVMAYLMYRQNELLKEQNKIMASEGKLDSGTEEAPTFFSRYWPILTNLLLVMAMWSAVGFENYERNKPIPQLPLPTNTITPDNAQASIEKWCDNFGMGERVLNPPNPGSFFTLQILGLGGRNLFVDREKTHDQYIMISTRLTPAPDLRDAIQKLTARELQNLDWELSIAMSNSRAGYDFPPTLETMHTFKRLPIEGLTEKDFISAADDVANTTVIGMDTIALRAHAKPQIPAKP